EDENGNWKEIPKEDAEEESYSADNPYMNLPDQEWRKNTGGLSSGEIQTRNAIKNGTYEGEDAEQKLEAINYHEQQYGRSEEHTSELQSRFDRVCRLLL